MPNIATALKSEISRIARKEQRRELASLKQAVKAHRTAITVMRKRLETLERMLKNAQKGGRQAAAPSQATEEGSGPRMRFSAKGFAAHRQRLGISAAAMAKLLGVSGLSVYKWESGKTRPRAKQTEAIAAVRKMGKREVTAKLEMLGE